MKTGIVILTMLTLGAIVITMTCCGNDDVTKGEDNTVVEEPNAEPETPPQTTPPSDQEPETLEPEISDLDRAREAYKIANQKIDELLEKNPQIDLQEITSEVYGKEFGFDAFFVFNLFEIYLKENPKAEKDRFNGTSLILEYLRLSFKFPGKREEGLLRLFRESVREGNVSADVNNPKPSLEKEEEEGDGEDGEED